MKNLTALKITIAYLVFGILWILFSDFLVKEYTSVPDLYFFLETSKGLLFVLLSALLVYLLSRRLLKKELSTIDEEKSKIVDNYENEINRHTDSIDDLLKSHEELNALVQSELQAFVLLNTKGIITLFNRTAEKYISVVTGRILIKGEDFLDYTHPDYIETYKKNFAGALAGKSTASEREFVIEGRKRWVRFNYSPAYNGENKIFGVVFTGIEITEAVEAMNKQKQSLEVYTELLKATPDAVAILNSKGIIEYLSPVAFDMMKTDTDSGAIGQSCLKWFTEESADRVMKSIGGIVQKGLTTKGNVYEMIRVDGTTFMAEFNSSPIRDTEGNITSFISTFRDVTEKLDAERKLIDYSVELRELNASKDRFFSIVAHDLRNPLQGLLGFSGLLNDSLSDLTTDEIKEYIGYIYTSAKKMHVLTNNLLQWSRIKTGNISFSPEKFLIKDAVGHIADLLKPNAMKKGISLEVISADSLAVICDRGMFDSILQNLISNAIKFSKNFSKVEIFSRKTGDGFIQVNVRDYGVGIAKENFSKIFSIDSHFSTNGTSDEEGTGLGLILCKELVEKQGGKITFESELKFGSTFSFTVPAAK
jgi:PAS domain S-box-containing protein